VHGGYVFDFLPLSFTEVEKHIIELTFVVVTAISAYQFIKYKIRKPRCPHCGKAL
jgi:hypothetical protein